jgi:ComF family protein
MLRPLADALLSALIAPPCAACGRVIDNPLDGAVCDACWRSVVCSSGDFALPHVVHARALGPYDGVLREILHALKYDGRRSCAARLSRMMGAAAAAVLDNADAVVPVPLHARRLRERGFNQAADLAAGLDKPVWNAVRRTRHTRSQVDLPANRRHANVAGAFTVERSPYTLEWLLGRRAPPLRGAMVVLIDDVATTGATLDACARALLAAGVREVRALTAARVVP